MFKLLTEEVKKRVRGEYTTRRAIVVVTALNFIAVVGIIGLLPSYALSDVRYNEATERMKILEVTGMVKDTSAAEAWLKNINIKLKTLNPKLDTDRPSEVLSKVTSLKVPGISINNFSWIRAKTKVTIGIDGVAVDRQTLIDFRDRINDSGEFSDVSFPVSNLAQDRDINFQIKLSPVKAKPEPKATTTPSTISEQEPQ